ncbi:BRO1-domain-containing protein [Thelephora terrestris]|uniref:BRO1-domain-containing protein n=1 Tax=Thelephora terrestris TaxID=56493 RepID=A0A9P6L267_9AGAM|nr:BRO1-domain-containing protein [Thelephora terrestris]
MSNLLALPLKKTSVIPVAQAARKYIQDNLPDSNPDAFKWDFKQWESFRKRTLSDVIHVDLIQPFLDYHAQLVFILTKLPADIGLEIPYSLAFASSNTRPISLSNIVYERCAVLFNLASLYSQIAYAEDRSSPDGLKTASKYYQQAAGVLKYLGTSVLPRFYKSLDDAEPPLEFTNAFINSLELLMLGQAQECAWQLVLTRPNSSNSIIARLSTQVSIYYDQAALSVREASPSIKHLFPSNWLVHIQSKALHFDAAAQYRKANEELEGRKYGQEIGRLQSARKKAKEGIDIARKGGASASVLNDLNSLLSAVENDLKRAERDNDLIYHQVPPSLTSLQPISPASMVKSDVPSTLTDPQSVIQRDGVIFGELLALGTRKAIDIYNHRKDGFISDEIVGYAVELNEEIDAVKKSLSLPAVLDALGKPISLPPSLLAKAREIRGHNTPSLIENSLDVIEGLSFRNHSTLEEAIGILDDEAEEDENFREGHDLERPQSHEANSDLIVKHSRYLKVLEQASASDKQVRNKWDEWKEIIEQLCWDEETLEASVPSPTVVPGKNTSNVNQETRRCARDLRALLEKLEDLKNSRSQTVQRARFAAESDDITSRVLREAAGVEQWTEVQPTMFEDTFEQEMSKYDKFKSALEEGDTTQKDLLSQLRERNQALIASRQDDPVVKEREHAIQSLELAYHKCKEIEANLAEGTKFHQEFLALLKGFKDECQQWTNQRSSELELITRSMTSMSLDNSHKETDSNNPLTAPLSPSELPSNIQGLGLPPPDSDDWEELALPPPPLVTNRSKTMARGGR